MRVYTALLFFGLGALFLSSFPIACSQIPESIIERPAPLGSLNTVAWKIRDHISPGARVTISARHSEPGPAGRFHFVVYESLKENYEAPRLVLRSESYEVDKSGDESNWSFIAQYPVLFVGISWSGATPPIGLERQPWSNPNSFTDTAYLGIRDELKYKQGPIRGTITLEEPRKNFGSPVVLWVTPFLFIVALAFKMKTRVLPTNLELVAFLIGVVFSYRVYATDSSPHWSWGSYHLSFLNPPWPWAIALLTALLGLSLLIFGRLPSKVAWRPSWKTKLFFVLILTALAWLFRSNKIYGDWVFGYTNHTHAPLTAGLYAFFEGSLSWWPWAKTNLKVLISVLLFAPLLWSLSAFIRDEEKDSALSPWVVLLFLSASTLQVFFGEVEVYSVPILLWTVFALTTFRFLEGRLDLWVPTLVSFIAYILHVAEAVLIFSVIYLWIWDGLRSRPQAKVVIRRIFGLATAAVALTAFHSLLLYAFKFNWDLNLFRRETSYFGFEILWGQHRHAGVVLPLFSIQPPIGAFTPPGPDYAAFSRDGVLKVLGFWFHYSLFFFALPIMILIRDKARQLKDPKVASVFISFAAYSVYCLLAYVGWFPVIRDWSLFAIYAFIAATLTYLLIRDDESAEGIALSIISVNLLQTLPWIFINHFQISVPW